MKHLHVDPQSEIPVHVQIKEQIKVALALGHLKPGEALPSIRAVENETGVGRMLVRKAYQQLEEAGLVEVAHGRRTVVTQLQAHNGELANRAEALAGRFVMMLESEGLDPLSFSRLFHQTLLSRTSTSPSLYCVHDSRTVATEFAEQVKEVLGVPARASSLRELMNDPDGVSRGVRILTSYYFLEEVRDVLGESSDRIVPVSFRYASTFLERLEAVSSDTPVIALFYRHNLKTDVTRSAIEDLIERPECRHLNIEIRDLESLGTQSQLLRRRKHLYLVSNSIWDNCSNEMAKHPDRFWRLEVCIDRRSLRAVRAKLGIVV